MKPVHAKRLLRLADFLENLPDERFNFSVWVGSTWKGHEDLSCGTTACALGWAAAMPEFRKLGARLKRLKSYSSFIHIKGRRNSDAYDVAKRLFGLDVDDYQALFVTAEEYRYRDAKEVVVQGIRAFVDRKHCVQQKGDVKP